MERIFWGMRGENSSVAGGLAVVVITKKRKDRKMRMGCIMVVRTWWNGTAGDGMKGL